MHQILWLLFIGTVWYNFKLCLDSQIPCYDSGWFGALQLVTPALEALAKTKNNNFLQCFFPLILRLQLSHNAI